MKVTARMIAILCAGIVSATLLVPVHAQETPTSGPDVGRFDTTKQRYLPRREVRVVYRNTTDETQRLTSPWTVRDRDGRAIARLLWSDEHKVVGPDGLRAWGWPQDFNSCGSDGACTDVGGFVDPGRYKAVAHISGEKRIARFRIGRYFTMKFGCNDTQAVDTKSASGTSVSCATLPDPLTFFTSRQKTIRRLREDLGTPIGHRREVSGRIGGEVSYNPNWSFSLKPGSVRVVDGDTGCETSVYKVEESPKKWHGRRWCDSAGYVAREGR